MCFYSWLTAQHMGFSYTIKTAFWGSLALRYIWLDSLLCIVHVVTASLLVTPCHVQRMDFLLFTIILTELLSEVCHDMEIEPHRCLLAAPDIVHYSVTFYYLHNCKLHLNGTCITSLGYACTHYTTLADACVPK